MIKRLSLVISIVAILGMVMTACGPAASTYTGTLEREDLQLQRSFAGGRGGGFAPGAAPAPPAGAIVPLGQAAGSAPPAVGPPPDGADPSSAGFIAAQTGGGGGGRRGMQAAGPMVLRKAAK